jgi:hypothetical protein
MAAPKGNKNGIGHGRPPIYEQTPENVEIVSNLVDDYFEYIKGEYEENDGEETIKDPQTGLEETRKYKYQHWIRKSEPPTVTGLTLHLGFADKSTLYDYSKKDCFSHSIKRGLVRIEQHHEFKIADGDRCTGNIFALKNFGWVDRIHQDISFQEQPLLEQAEQDEEEE